MVPGPRRRPRVTVITAAAITAAALASAAYQEAAAARDRRRFPPPGRLVDVGGHRLHMLEAGHGTPAVVVVPSLGDGVLLWARIQRELAAEMQVVAYDRAGIGWSDPPPRGPRTFDNAAGELRALLDSAGIEPPYVLVGHSVGGVIARRLAACHPGIVAGMVLIDSSHEQQAVRRGFHGWPYGRSNYLGRALRHQLRILGARRLAAGLGLLRQLDADIADIADIARAAPAADAGAYRAILLSTRLRRVMIRENLMMARSSDKPPSLGSIPLTVITAGDQRLPGWREMQDELAALSANSIHLTAEGSGHYVHLDDPEIVCQAIRKLVRRVNSG